MKLNDKTKFLIVGLGLIGGSYAEALHSKGYEVGAIDVKKNAIEYALRKGIIDHGRDFADGNYVRDFDVVVFALYPHAFIDWIKTNQRFFKTGALITDVTGVKTSVVYEVQSILRKDVEFIGAHPMAGKETSGVENADACIFDGANYIVTPTDGNTVEAVETAKEIGKELGFDKISVLSPEKHDEIVGFLSHLTHCIAVSMMVSKDPDHFKQYSGDSFRDLTRIAKINDEMWSELFLMNKKELLSQMNLFEERFNELKKYIEEDNREKIREVMRLSTERRKIFDKSED